MGRRLEIPKGVLRAGSKLLRHVQHGSAFLFLEQRFLSAFPRPCLQRKMLWKWGSRVWVSRFMSGFMDTLHFSDYCFFSVCLEGIFFFLSWPFVSKNLLGHNFKLLFFLQFQQQKCRPRGEDSTVGRNSCTWSTQVRDFLPPLVCETLGERSSFNHSRSPRSSHLLLLFTDTYPLDHGLLRTYILFHMPL